MKTYTVIGKEIVYRRTTVEAESPEEAKRIAEGDEIWEWEEYDGEDWKIIEVEEGGAA